MFFFKKMLAKNLMKLASFAFFSLSAVASTPQQQSNFADTVPYDFGSVKKLHLYVQNNNFSQEGRVCRGEEWFDAAQVNYRRAFEEKSDQEALQGLRIDPSWFTLHRTQNLWEIFDCISGKTPCNELSPTGFYRESDISLEVRFYVRSETGQQSIVGSVLPYKNFLTRDQIFETELALPCPLSQLERVVFSITGPKTRKPVSSEQYKPLMQGVIAQTDVPIFNREGIFFAHADSKNAELIHLMLTVSTATSHSDQSSILRELYPFSPSGIALSYNSGIQMCRLRSRTPSKFKDVMYGTQIDRQGQKKSIAFAI